MSPTARIIEAIRTYWRDQGYSGIRVWCDDSGVIRSNIGPRGYPPKIVG